MLFFAWFAGAEGLISAARADFAHENSAMALAEQAWELRQHERLRQLQAAAPDRRAPFVSDGCSGGLSVVWGQLSAWIPAFGAIHGERPPWESCCVEHDRVYHAGGLSETSAQASVQARLRADQRLRHCVIETGTARTAPLSAHYGLSEAQIADIYRVIADLMYRSVRLGGGPCTGLPWRWGYGWPDCGAMPR